LDEVIDSHVPRPKDIQPKVRDVLQLAAYELLFAHTSSHVVVHQGVEAVKKATPYAAGFANAVLRKIAEHAATFPWGDPATDDGALARATGHPRWLVDALLKQFERDTVTAMLEANNEPAPLYVAHNPFAGTLESLHDALVADGAAPEPTPLVGCIRCRDAAAAVTGSALSSGLCIVADAGAQLVARMASVPPGGIAVDIGAGRGGKTLLIQSASGGEANVVAVDVHEYKTRLLIERMRELKVPGVRAVVADATDTRLLHGAVGSTEAQAVLVDAPCSGLGTLRRAPEKRWRLSPHDLEKLAALGSDLLTAASTLVRPGGVVVYSTCTVLAMENEDVVRAFLGSTPGTEFEVCDVGGHVPDEWSGFRTGEGFFQSVPTVDGPDGHFAAVLRRGRASR